jgi:chromosome segregation ATPase
MSRLLATDPLSSYLTVSVSVQWIIGVITSVLLFRLRADREDVKQLETRLHATSERLIDERMIGLSHKVKNHAQSLTTSIDAITASVSRHSDLIDKLGDRDQSAELKTLREIKDMQIEIVRNTASKSDLKEHQGAMHDQVKQLRSEISDLARRTNGH